MWGPFRVQGAAESDASVRLGVGSHVPGRRSDRAQADEERIKKGIAVVETPSEGMGPQTRRIAFGNPIRLWAVFKKGPVHGPLPENPESEREVNGVLDRWQVRA
jgi:hypothetical protein